MATSTLNFGPTSVNIIIVRGDSPVIEVIIQDQGTQAAINITGGQFILTVDPSDSPVDSTSKLFELVGTITNATEGLVSFQPSISNSAQDPADYYYDVQMVLGISTRTILKGTFTILADISKG